MSYVGQANTKVGQSTSKLSQPPQVIERGSLVDVSKLGQAADKPGLPESIKSAQQEHNRSIMADAQLDRVIAAWVTLPEHVRNTIVSIVEGVKGV